MANPNPNPNPIVFFDLTVGDKPAGWIEMELFADTTPKTAENFRALCTGEKGMRKESVLRLHYKGTSIHHLEPNAPWYGGDISHSNGNGAGDSIYGGEFEHENFIIKHDLGTLTMENWGENTIICQFMILPTKFKSMDGEYVAFGKVVKGLDLMKSIAEEVATESGIPSKPLVIADCGQIFPKSEGLVPMTTMGAFVILMFGVLLFLLRLDFHFGVWLSLEV